MAKKKGLLSEATVRRFMGLAGMDVKLSSNILKEAGMYEEEEEAADLEPAPDAGGEELGGEELGGEEVELGADEPAMDAGAEGEVELSPEDIKGARDAVEKLLAPLEANLPAEGGEELGGADELGGAGEELGGGEEELGAEEPAPDAEEEEVIAEALSGINIQLTGDDLVQEVTRRVARRLLKAKKAQQALDEALGKKKATPRRRVNRRRK